MSSELAGDVTDLIEARLRQELARLSRRPLVLGLCAAQGSGKSTVAQALQRRLGHSGISGAVLSLDDLYLTREARLDLSAVHPLLRTRGVPGTHDVSLGLAVLEACGCRGKVALPRFSKADDTRCALEQWPVITTPVDVVIFEGWCVGARPQHESALVAPVNEFERDEDGGGRWRRWVNRQLATTYVPLFARIDLLVLLAAPDFTVVAGWRKQQEASLRDRLAAEGRPTDGAMTDREIDRFVAHFQRLTEFILAEMPQRADLVVRLDRQRRPVDPSISPY